MKMANLMFTATHRPDAREKGAFKYVSFDWTGATGWFFWPKTQLGVYALKADCSESPKQPVESDWLLYYYPSPQEPLFTTFSCTEQLVRVSDAFSRESVTFSTECPHCDCESGPHVDLLDGKGIPTPEVRETLSPDLFHIGTVTLSWNGYELQSLNAQPSQHGQTWTKEPLDIATSDGVQRLLNAGEMDRNLPCEELTSTFRAMFMAFVSNEMRNTQQRNESVDMNPSTAGYLDSLQK
jgi:hypothetical protein